ncbi:MAG TPA: ABC transporter substrate-binding protein, partial [Pirellulales bacterium]
MRIVSLISAGTEMLFALGLGEQVVGVSHECDFPSECQKLPRVSRANVNSNDSSQQIDDTVRQLLAEGKPLYEIDRDLLASLKPDLVVTQAQCDVCAVKYDDVVSTVNTLPELKQTQIFSLNPQSLADVLDDIQHLGEATGCPNQAARLVADLNSRIEVVRKSAAEVSSQDRPRTAMIEWTEPLMLAGNWVPELVELAGGNCPLTTPGEHSHYHTWEELRQFDPEVMVVCPCGFDEHRARQELNLLAKHPGWK